MVLAGANAANAKRCQFLKNVFAAVKFQQFRVE